MRDAIIQGIRTILWCSTWADHVEEHGCASLAGQRIDDIAPPCPGEAEEAACELASAIERANGYDLESMYQAAVCRCAAREGLTIPAWEGKHGAGRGSPERFGNCLAWEALGAGVSWEDDWPAHGYITRGHDVYRKTGISTELLEMTLRDIHDRCTIGGSYVA